jgi:hypothetical protein
VLSYLHHEVGVLVSERKGRKGKLRCHRACQRQWSKWSVQADCRRAHPLVGGGVVRGGPCEARARSFFSERDRVCVCSYLQVGNLPRTSVTYRASIILTSFHLLSVVSKILHSLITTHPIPYDKTEIESSLCRWFETGTHGATRLRSPLRSHHLGIYQISHSPKPHEYSVFFSITLTSQLAPQYPTMDEMLSIESWKVAGMLLLSISI